MEHLAQLDQKKKVGQDGHWVSSQMSSCTNKNDMLPIYLGIIVTNYICM